MHKDSQYEQHPDTICPISSPPHPSGRHSLRILLPEVRQTKTSRGGLYALTESASAFLPRASLRPYRERPCAPIMIVLVPSVKGGKPAPPSRSAKGAGPTPRDNNHVKSCCLTNISLTLVQESDLLVSVSVTGTDIMIALAVAYTPTGCTGSR